MIAKMPQAEAPLALVADDDISLRLSMAAALIKVGFTVVEAQNGREALALFRSNRPDLVLLDLMMPEMDGFDTCTTMRSLPGGEYTQILMVTGLDDSHSIERAFEVGANDFISKPLNWVMLGHRARYMLRAGHAFRELNRNRRRLAKTQELAELGNWEYNFLTNDFHCSREANCLLGLSSDRQSSLKDFLSSVNPREYDQVAERFTMAIKGKTPISMHYRILLPDGSQKHILNRAEVFFNESGVAEILLGAVQNVTELKNAEEEIRLLAFYDGLTGLANRTLFMDRLRHELLLSKRQDKFCAILFLDLDQFKRVNDTFGHHVGDLLLKHVSETLQRCIRVSDSAVLSCVEDSYSLVARLGGDEFIILLSDIKTPEDAAIIARRILHEIPVLSTLEGHQISVTTSIGISVFPTDGEDVEVLLKHADSAMYYAKEKGRNKYQFYEKSLNDTALERFTLENDIAMALERGEFYLYYQPQLDLATRKIVGAEALIRWVHPQREMVLPEEFISIAEESGIIVDINKWVIQTACRQNNKWILAGSKPIRIAVNLSGYNLVSQNIISTLKEALQEDDLDATHLEVEITENVLMQNTEDNIQILQQMKDLSLRIALDDFGTGFSSLSYLTNFPVDILKIDRSFVMGCTTHKNNIVIIKAIIAMGHSLGMKIVAEGIETEEQLELLLELGADEGQGYLFSPPVPQELFVELMEKGTL